MNTNETNELNESNEMNELRDKLCRKKKTIHDDVHGYISLSYFAIKIMDTKYFQRLRKLKQLGLCCYVYQNATHTRFEHSIGTYYLAEKILERIIRDTDENILYNYIQNIKELSDCNKSDIKKYIFELIKIAALCHDIGHGPFSHVFDDLFLLDNNTKSSHENRSCIILEYIIKNDDELNKIVSHEHIKFIQSLINPDNTKHFGWIYQIVSNNLSSLDVDKYDYLKRDVKTLNFPLTVDIDMLINHIKIINDNITYPEQSLYDIYNLFQIRYQLHKRVYSHKVVIAIQLMIIDMIKLLDNILNITDIINKISNDIFNNKTDIKDIQIIIDNFCNLTDDYIMECPLLMYNLGLCNDSVLKSIEILNKLNKRDIYATIYNGMDDKKQIDKIKLLSDDNIVLSYVKLGFVSGNKQNPLDSIYTYKTKETQLLNDINSFKKDKNDLSILCPSQYQENILMIFYKDKTNIEKINKLRKLFIVNKKIE